MRYLKASFFLFYIFCSSLAIAQYTIPEKPKGKEQTSVYDYINLLSPSEKTTLEQKLIRYSDSTSTQIVIAIINSTQGENINYLGAQWGQKWGIGQKGKDNGVLILLAKNDRKIAINTGYGVEGSLTDAMSRRIIQKVIIPHFKTDNFYTGLNSGSNAIFRVLNGEFKEERTFNDNQGFPFQAILPFIIFVIILIIISNKKSGNGGGNGGRRSSGFDLRDIIILSNMGRSSGGGSFGGSGGGGGFSGGFGGGFGGGGFGGGGASGGW